MTTAIVHLCLGKASPHRMNGVNVVVDALARTQKQQGVDVRVWGITPTPDVPTSPRDYPLTLFKGQGRRFAMPDGLEQAVDDLQTDVIIHFHGVMTPVFYTVARYLKKRGVKWVVTPHGAYHWASLRHRAWLKWPYIVLLDRFILRHAYKIHVGVMAECNAVRWLCRGQQIVAVKNCQDAIDLSDIAVDRQGHARPIFGFVGRLAYRHKGLDLLLNAFAAYVSKGGKGTLWLIGDGDDKAFLQRLIKRRNIQDRVVFHGGQFAQDKLNLIASMDVFVHTSRWEVNPIAVLEALTVGTPVLISRQTNMGDAVATWQAGFVLQNNDIQNICDALLHIDQNISALPAMGEKARQMITNDFNWHDASRDMLNRLY